MTLTLLVEGERVVHSFGDAKVAEAARDQQTLAPHEVLYVAAGSVSPGKSMWAHRRLAAGLTLVGVLVGALYVYLRPPTYSAVAQLYVGKTLSLANTAAIAGLATAANQIASDYSRLLSNSTVQDDVGKLMHDGGHLPGSLSASPIPESPVIDVHASASKQGVAVALATAGSKALVKAVDQINVLAQSEVTQLQSSYATAEVQAASLQATITVLKGDLAALSARPQTSTTVAREASLSSKISADSSSAQVDQLKASAASAQYEAQVSSLQDEEQVISPVGSATSTGSNRKKLLEIALLAGLIGGLVVAAAVATAIDVRRQRSER